MAMSLCDDTLLCNFPKCRAKLSGFAWVTACSHAFCDQHGSGEFSRSPAICPACSSMLSGKLDIVRTELAPSEEYKAMVLAGLRPDTVMDICARALTFWSYQIQQEHMYQEYSLSRAESQVKQIEQVLAQQNQSRELERNNMRGEIISLKKVMEEYKRKYSEMSERLMERNRQYQKLQGLYDSLRLRNMVVGQREAPPRQGQHEFSTGVVRQASPQGSPQFLHKGPEGNGRFFCLEPDGGAKGDSHFFSCPETDGGAKTFFQFSSPARDRGRPFMKKH